jgi:Domain of unknown function (DUF4282)
MAGQPPDGTWQSASSNGLGGPNGQDQVRMAWEAPPPYEQSAYEGYPPPHAAQQPSFQPGGQAYGAGAREEEHHTMAWEQPPGQQAGWDPAPGQQAGWQSSAAEFPAAEFPAPGPAGFTAPGGANVRYPAAGSRAASHSKGFVASLFDFGFTSYVTPKVVKGLYLLSVAWTVIVAIFLLLVGIHLGGATAGTIIFVLIGIAVFGLLSLGSIRVFLEFFMALHRINENIQVLRDRGDEK